jgi:beta-galactosidase
MSIHLKRVHVWLVVMVGLGMAPAFMDTATCVAQPMPRNDRNSQIAHAQLVEKTGQGRVDIYFQGDSITRRWGALDYPELLANWKENFFGWNAADFAWGGDSVQNILWRLENGELDNVNPKVFVLLAGTNNVGSRPARGEDDPRIAGVTAGIQAIVDVFQAKAPEATIILTGIFPRNDNRGNPTAVMGVIDAINKNLAAMADGKKIRYININDKLADKDGNLFEGMTVDRLHLSLKGYQVWADALKPIFTELLGPPAQEDHAPPATGDPSATNRVATEAAWSQTAPRERVSLNANWRFMKYASAQEADELIYDARPEVRGSRGVRPADAMPTEAVRVAADRRSLKDWILPTGNNFVADPARRHARPEGDPGSDFPFVQSSFDDRSWQAVNLPHDWAIEGPFNQGQGGVGGGMGRLPSPGVAWYRKKLDIPASDAGKSIFLDVDGAMSYAMVWLNGHLVGGWPYGYASWRVNLTPYVVPGGHNQLAIRLDNPPESARWYPGGGIYRNVWLVKTDPVHVGQWGTFVTTRDVSQASATIDLAVVIDNDSPSEAAVETIAEIFALNANGDKTGATVVRFKPLKAVVAAGGRAKVEGFVTLENPRLWGPPPTQTPNRYMVVTSLRRDGKLIDRYETSFGIRSLRFDADAGIYVNGERIFIKGVNQHHDLGALGAAFNVRAAERQLEVLREAGCNAIRTAHNPPAPELLELTDRMGFLVMDEIFDVWERTKTPLDFHLIFPDWHEQDVRAFVRRDRNHPSVIVWSFGNEVGEQYTGQAGTAVAQRLHDIMKTEDPTRPTTAAMNYAKPDMPLPPVMDMISLNYQGEGIRDAEAYAGLRGIRTSPLYPAFHGAFPDKVILSSENAAALSSRGTYLFPVSDSVSAPVRDGAGGDPRNQHVSAYELYTADFGSSADKVFGSLDRHPYVAGGFVWSGWDYLGEPTPYYSARSSYFGIIDLAGFPKDRFYLYQSRWRPDLAMAHILPHWTWPDRVGQVTPVHVFTSGDEAELFLDGKSLGRKTKGEYEYRLRWDDVIYRPGELKVVAYKAGKEWATDVMRTAGPPAKLLAKADRSRIVADGQDLSFVTVTIVDRDGIPTPQAKNRVRFSIDGPGEIVATDNGDPTSFESFHSRERNAFGGLCLVIVRAKPDQTGTITLKAESEGLEGAVAILGCKAVE